MEIEKDKRLPTGRKSWISFLAYLKSQDEMILQKNDNIVLTWHHGPATWQEAQDSTYDNMIERGEYDIASIKIRSADEIKDIIPERSEISNFLKEYEYLKMISKMCHNETNPVVEFLKELRNLL